MLRDALVELDCLLAALQEFRMLCFFLFGNACVVDDAVVFEVLLVFIFVLGSCIIDGVRDPFRVLLLALALALAGVVIPAAAEAVLSVLSESGSNINADVSDILMGVMLMSRLDIVINSRIYLEV